MTILVKGQPLNELFHNGATYVEGHPGTPFTVRVYNQSSQRRIGVELVIGGVPTKYFDDKTKSPISVIKPESREDFVGWMEDGEIVMPFTFGDIPEISKNAWDNVIKAVVYSGSSVEGSPSNGEQPFIADKVTTVLSMWYDSRIGLLKKYNVSALKPLVLPTANKR